MNKTDHKHRPERRMIMRLGGVLAMLGAAWAGGLFWFAASIPEAVSDPAARTDAIVVLTGGSGRLGAGLELLSVDRARKLFVSGVYRGVDVAKLLELARRTPEELRCCVEIGYSADNTAGNAAETATWMRKQGYRSLRIVTANYHMPRSLLEFGFVMPATMLIAHPVFPAHVKRDRWWAWPGTAYLIVSEYNKFILAWLRHRTVGRWAADSAS